MRTRPVLFACLAFARLSAQEKPAVPDTSAIVASIEQRMMIIDHAPIGAVYLIYPDREEAVLLQPDSAVRGNPLERDEFYIDPQGHIGGVGAFLSASSQASWRTARTISIWTGTR